MQSKTRSLRRKRGAVSVWAVLGMVVLLGLGALALDVGMIWNARTQLQRATDSAALAAAVTMVDRTIPATTLDASRAEAAEFAGKNATVGAASTDAGGPGVVLDEQADVTFGRWDRDNRVFETAGVDLNDPFDMNAVQVAAQMDGQQNAPVPAVLGRVLGHDGFPVEALSTGLLGCQGGAGPGEVDLPIVVDCCQIAGPSCDADFCQSVANPTGACPLSDQGLQNMADPGPVSCIEFHPTLQQNACWTQFDGSQSGINTSTLRDIVEDGNPVELTVGEEWYLDNGTKKDVVQEIEDRFRGGGKSKYTPAGSDRYAPFNGNSDSWVVRLPVAECQTGIHCAGGSPMEVKGFVCFEILDVQTTSEKIIYGRFLCPSNLPPQLEDVFEEKCQPAGTPPGGDCFGLLATQPRLVE